jgi:hypothetical protein
MSVSPEEIKAWAGAGAACIAAFKEAISLLPDGEKKRKAEQEIKRAESENKKAEAFVAARLGFQICTRCWPPEVMLVDDDGIAKCRNCRKPFPAAVRSRGPHG